MTIRAAFLDRDGPLIRHVHYLHRPKEVEVLPTVVEALVRLLGVVVGMFLHTNQAGGGRGVFAESAARACNDEMPHQLGLGDCLFEQLCIATEGLYDEVVYRKPSPRFAREVTKAAGLAADEVCYVGDNRCEIETGHNVGCLAVGVKTCIDKLAFPSFSTFGEAVIFILASPKPERAQP